MAIQLLQSGDANSAASIPTTSAPFKDQVPVEFQVESPAETVFVAGSFNNWDPTLTPLKRQGNTWRTTLQLPHGCYEYRFVVDGQWMADPNATETAPNPFGESNSLRVV